jgi:hypothetical protein
MKIIALEESVNFATLDIDKLFSKFKSHELSRKGRSNYDTSFTSKALITSKAMLLTPPTLSHLLWSLLYLLLLQLPMSNTRAFPMMRLPCLQGNFGRCTSFRRRGEEDHETPRVLVSAVTPPTSSLTAPRGRSMTTPIRMITTTRMTTRRRITSGTRRRRILRRSCPEHVQH